jgi:hypothetical protein
VANGAVTRAIPDAKGAIVVPIPGIAEAVAGVLVLATTRRREYGEPHVQVLSSYATFIGAALNAPNVGSERGALVSQVAANR